MRSCKVLFIGLGDTKGFCDITVLHREHTSATSRSQTIDLTLTRLRASVLSSRKPLE